MILVKTDDFIRFEDQDEATTYCSNNNLTAVCLIVDDVGNIYGECFAKWDASNPDYDHPFDDPNHQTIEIVWKDPEHYENPRELNY